VAVPIGVPPSRKVTAPEGVPAAGGAGTVTVAGIARVAAGAFAATAAGDDTQVGFGRAGDATAGRRAVDRLDIAGPTAATAGPAEAASPAAVAVASDLDVEGVAQVDRQSRRDLSAVAAASNIDAAPARAADGRDLQAGHPAGDDEGLLAGTCVRAGGRAATGRAV